jgi:hypothetical protein
MVTKKLVLRTGSVLAMAALIQGNWGVTMSLLTFHV